MRWIYQVVKRLDDDTWMIRNCDGDEDAVVDAGLCVGMVGTIFPAGFEPVANWGFSLGALPDYLTNEEYDEWVAGGGVQWRADWIPSSERVPKGRARSYNS